MVPLTVVMSGFERHLAETGSGIEMRFVAIGNKNKSGTRQSMFQLFLTCTGLGVRDASIFLIMGAIKCGHVWGNRKLY